MNGVRSRRHTGSLWATLSGSPWATVDSQALMTAIRLAIEARKPAPPPPPPPPAKGPLIRLELPS